MGSPEALAAASALLEVCPPPLQPWPVPLHGTHPGPGGCVSGRSAHPPFPSRGPAGTLLTAICLLADLRGLGSGLEEMPRP